MIRPGVLVTPVDTSLDLDNTKLYGIRPSTPKTAAKKRQEQRAGEDMGIAPPALIDIVAENYKLQIASRIAGYSQGSMDPIPLPPILMDEEDEDYYTEDFLEIHFTPEKSEELPRRAQLFDVKGATLLYNEKVSEHREWVLYQASLVCEKQAQKGPRRSTVSPQRTPPRNNYERQQKGARGTLPAKGEQRQVKRRAERAEDDPFLGGSLMIRKVAVPTGRPMSSRPAARKPLIPREQPPKSAPRRYRSPPPRGNTRRRNCESARPQYSRGDYDVVRSGARDDEM